MTLRAKLWAPGWYRAHGDPIVGEGHATLRRFVDEQQSAR